MTPVAGPGELPGLIDGNDPLDRYRCRRVVVLGATGFIGRWVARLLYERGAHLALPVRDRAAAQALFSRYRIRGDLTDLDLADFALVQEYLRQIGPAVTFNLAGYGVDRSQREAMLMNRMNAQLVEALGAALVDGHGREWLGPDIVHAGSALEYGKIGGHLSENSVPNPTTPYGRSKLAGTEFLSRFCRSHGVKGVVARLFTVYGPGERSGRLLPSVQQAARNGTPVSLTVGTQCRDFTYVEDVAEGLLRLGVAAPALGEVVNVATGKLTTVRSFAETAAKIHGLPLERLRFGEIPNHYDEMEHDDVALDRLRRLTAWLPPTDVASGVRRTLEREAMLRQTELAITPTPLSREAVRCKRIRE